MPDFIRKAYAAVVDAPGFKRWSAQGVVRLAYLLHHDPIAIAHAAMGIGNCDDGELSGEHWLAKSWMPRFFEALPAPQPVIFDVGANMGKYSRLVSNAFPAAQVHAFEPHPETYVRLVENVKSFRQIATHNLALGSHTGKVPLWSSSNPVFSEHATVHAKVLERHSCYGQIVANSVDLGSLDEVCENLGIRHIHFLKIDTEGNEMEVLRGAHRLLRSGEIDSIQFEFNEMNIVSRVFLKDFFDKLKDFHLYRLQSASLTRIHYSSREEIFQFQNILAVREEIDMEARLTIGH